MNKKRGEGNKIAISDYVKDTKKHLNLPGKVLILDTTLRDGEQTPGASLTKDEKLDIAHWLEKLGVNVIEAGFPSVSEGEFNAVKEIAETTKCDVMALTRALKQDIDKAAKTNVKWIHTFIGTSKLHREYKLKMSKEEIKKKAMEAVEHIKELGLKCEFSCEDATRTELDYLLDVYKSACDAGADKINVPDTVGVMTPRATFELISNIRKHIKKPISMHCHNDFGLAVANSLAGVEAGAMQVHCTVNGIGERGGNASLEQVAISLYAFYGIKTVKLNMLMGVSEIVEKYIGISIPPNAPVVGRNAFSHESGIHVHGVMGNALTYEPYSPELVGNKRTIIIGKHSGAHAIRAIVEKYGVMLDENELAIVMRKIKEYADKGNAITERDVLSIVENITGKTKQGGLELKEFLVTTGNNIKPIARVELLFNGKIYEASGIGTGPIDAAIDAIKKALKKLPDLKLVKFRIDAIGSGTDTEGEVFIKLEHENGKVYFGRAVDRDIIKASINAFVDAYNKAFFESNH
ncbi:MAG: 2-isopropylmalate synthase [Candidatus Anstonellales archaeon]